jgi:hypothetical protein
MGKLRFVEGLHQYGDNLTLKNVIKQAGIASMGRAFQL